MLCAAAPCPNLCQDRDKEGVSFGPQGAGWVWGDVGRAPCPLSPHLCPVRQEDGTGRIACDAAKDENDGDEMPARQLLQVPQHRHLERH